MWSFSKSVLRKSATADLGGAYEGLRGDLKREFWRKNTSFGLFHCALFSPPARC